MESFACNLSAFTPAERKHHFEAVTPVIRGLVQGSKELPHGFAFELPDDGATIELATEWAASERLCCPFLSIALHLEPNLGQFTLQLTGPEGVKQFIKIEFAAWFK